jgi:adenosylcobinamide kinase / adenosylcobinamide-phosphate guanylyltransferase
VQPKRIFILGGAASGKSVFAEQLAENSGKRLIYLATAQAFDAEMREKIDRHIARRGNQWTALESPLDADSALSALSSTQLCLFDCATMWLSNHLLSESDMSATQTGLIGSIRKCKADLIIVSNEVGQGIVPENVLARQFREAQGKLNIALAAECDIAVQVIAGIPQVLKGALE